MFDTSMLGSSSAPLDIFDEAPAPPPPLTVAELQNLPKLGMPALKELCVAYDLKQSGVKAQLIARLKGESEPEHQPKVRSASLHTQLRSSRRALACLRLDASGAEAVKTRAPARP